MWHIHFNVAHSKEPETKLFSNGQHVLFIDYSVHLRCNFKIFTHFISCYLILTAIWGPGNAIHFTKRKQSIYTLIWPSKLLKNVTALSQGKDQTQFLNFITHLKKITKCTSGMFSLTVKWTWKCVDHTQASLWVIKLWR